MQKKADINIRSLNKVRHNVKPNNLQCFLFLCIFMLMKNLISFGWWGAFSNLRQENIFLFQVSEGGPDDDGFFDLLSRTQGRRIDDQRCSFRITKSKSASTESDTASRIPTVPEVSVRKGCKCEIFYLCFHLNFSDDELSLLYTVLYSDEYPHLDCCQQNVMVDVLISLLSGVGLIKSNFILCLSSSLDSLLYPHLFWIFCLTPTTFGSFASPPLLLDSLPPTSYELFASHLLWIFCPTSFELSAPTLFFILSP